MRTETDKENPTKVNDGWNVVRKGPVNQESGYNTKPRTFNKENREGETHHNNSRQPAGEGTYKKANNYENKRPFNKERLGE